MSEHTDATDDKTSDEGGADEAAPPTAEQEQPHAEQSLPPQARTPQGGESRSQIAPRRWWERFTRRG
jgi:hypothetical protein